MDQIRLRAYGKINLTLDVVGRRNDGYHLLESVMQSISLADELTLQVQEDFTLWSDQPNIPVDSRNTCYRAVQVFQDYTGIKVGVQIKLNKRIPAQAGLGGGSADAAAVLYGLNQLYRTNLSATELQALGLKIGADVPFCLTGGTAFVQGIGEGVHRINPFPPVSIVLVKPSQGISTQVVYENLSKSAYGGTSTRQLVEKLQAGAPVHTLCSDLANALESVTLNLVPEIEIWKERLIRARALTALMSGSGTTVFGIFLDQKLASEFQACWAKEGEILVVDPMPQGVEQLNGGDLL